MRWVRRDGQPQGPTRSGKQPWLTPKVAKDLQSVTIWQRAGSKKLQALACHAVWHYKSTRLIISQAYYAAPRCVWHTLRCHGSMGEYVFSRGPCGKPQQVPAMICIEESPKQTH